MPFSFQHSLCVSRVLLVFISGWQREFVGLALATQQVRDDSVIVLIAVTFPVLWGFKVSLRHEVEQYFRGGVKGSLDCLNLHELLASAAPISILEVVKCLVENVEEYLYTRAQSTSN